MTKNRVITVAAAVVATAVVIGYLRKSAQDSIKAGTKSEDTLAGKLGLV